jgi:dienelactone hydrolase
MRSHRGESYSQAATGMTDLVDHNAGLTTEIIDYGPADTPLEGFIAYDRLSKGKRPGVVVFHTWRGLDDYIRRRTEMVADLGYVAFAADIFGKGVRPKDVPERQALLNTYLGDRGLLRDRGRAALENLRAHPMVDSENLGAIGYCFGGCAALELARSGADVRGVASFHGLLSTPTPDDARNIRGSVLVLNGAEDPRVPPSDVDAFHKEMRGAGVDWQLVHYGNAVHSFTDSGAGNNPAAGSAYNEKADARSWRAMRDFLEEVFATDLTHAELSGHSKKKNQRLAGDRGA